MSCAINPREVYEYLIELGYQNITPQQLKEFIKDLKKLMKYDVRIEKEQSVSLENVSVQPIHRKQDIFSALHQTGTTSSKAKETSHKEKLISVQVKRPVCGDKCLTQKEKLKAQTCVSLLKSSTNTLSGSNNRSARFKENIAPVPIDRIKSTGNSGMISTHTLKPKTSFIRPRIPVRLCKSDPVALYHQYQAEWKRRNIPGESSHSDLRWVIRERMLGESESQVTLTGALKSKKQSSRL